MQEQDKAIGVTVVDVETTMNCPIKGQESNPFWPDNSIVAIGDKDAVGKTLTCVNFTDKIYGKMVIHWHYDNNTMFVAHNAAFDMHYLMCVQQQQAGPIIHPHRFALACGLWDTQLAEYLLEGQQIPYPSLDYCANKRGGTLKDSFVSDFFKRGEGADKVPKDKLEEYLRNDVENTHKVFESQFAEASASGMLPLIMSQMEARLATIDMGYNGIRVDWQFLHSRKYVLMGEVAGLKTVLLMPVTTFDSNGNTHGGVTLDLTAPLQLSKWLFGGTIKEDVRYEVGKYKNGKPKYKTETIELKIRPQIFELIHEHTKSVDDTVLDTLLASPVPTNDVKSVLLVVKEYRAKNKELTTYYEGISKAVMPDGFVHPNHNHCVARTGRLTSSNPNFQNISGGEKSDIKKAFISRWGDQGRIVEMDYGQLEIVVLAVLTQDRQLLQDLHAGTDVHTALFMDMYHQMPTKEERKAFKPRTFQLVYGAGAKAIAEQAGIDLSEAKRFIETFYTRYPSVKTWHEHVKAKVDEGRVYFGDKDKDGVPIGESSYEGFSKRFYVFKEYASTYKKGEANFSQSEIKNYPVQGTATGDIVPLVLGKLYRLLHAHPKLWDKCLMINTVHDSVLFDIHEDVLNEAITFCRNIMESAPKYIKETWNFDFNAGLKVGVSVGLNWLEQQDWKE